MELQRDLVRQKQSRHPKAPAVVSGPVVRTAVAADRLGRQAHLVVVAVQADMQAGTVAEAEQLAAFKAAPLARRRRRVGFRCRGGSRGRKVQLGHRAAPLWMEPANGHTESELVSSPQRSCKGVGVSDINLPVRLLV